MRRDFGALLSDAVCRVGRTCFDFWQAARASYRAFLHNSLGRISDAWHPSHAGRLRNPAYQAFRDRHRPFGLLSRASDSRKSLVANRGFRLPNTCGLGSCCEGDQSADDAQRVCLSNHDLVVADDLAFAGWDDRLRQAYPSGACYSRLESFFRAAGIAESGKAALAIRAEFPTLNDALSAQPALVRECAGPAAAEALEQAHELMVAALAEPLHRRPVANSRTDVARYLQQLIGFLEAETLIVLLLDSGGRLIRHDVVAYGGVDGVPFDPRLIILRALARGAAGMIVAHNHPSGDARPSRADMAATKRLASLAREFGIHLVDHLILARGETLSAMLGD